MVADGKDAGIHVGNDIGGDGLVFRDRKEADDEIGIGWSRGAEEGPSSHDWDRSESGSWNDIRYSFRCSGEEEYWNDHAMVPGLEEVAVEGAAAVDANIREDLSCGEDDCVLRWTRSPVPGG